jgi:epoxyqueuosine reductase
VPAEPQFVARVRLFTDEAGFELSGITAVPAAAAIELRYFPQWIEEGRSGDMAYLAARNEAGQFKRAALGNVAPWAKSVIVCGLNYNADAPRSLDAHPEGAGWISRYAWFAPAVDYHEAVLRRLRQVEARLRHEFEGLRTWCYVDTGPVVERVYAKYAGLGWIGKNTCILNEEMGSYFFLGVILTSFELPKAHAAQLPADRCGTCTRCIDACPTQALTPYQLDATRCISYLTIEKRGTIPQDLRPGIGRHIFGCDICQEVCPWNGAENPARHAPLTRAPEFTPRAELVNPALDWLAAMSREDFNRVFKDSPIKRAKFAGIKRNLAVAMGNSGDSKFEPALKTMAQEDDPVIAEHAEWALKRLR